MDFRKLIWILPLWVLLSAESALIASPQKVVSAYWRETPITIDGQLDEPAWAVAEPVSDFVQVEPTEGDPPTERTEVRVLFDEERLYIGAYLYDSAPDQILTNDLQRDFETRESDIFGVIIDAFNNDRASVSFFTNSGGAKQDTQALSDGRYLNPSWDGIWYTASKVHEDGWSCEIVIPFTTLRFEAQEKQTMGINFKRRIRRKNEDLYWSLVPRQYNSHHVSVIGDLLFDREIRPGRNLQLKPFLTANLTQTDRGSGTSNDFSPEGGLDVKYSLTSGLTLDGTYNTDFSQVEVDTAQINLTRFNLFFPEKREFFLENANLFQFGEIPGERGPRRTEETQLFFSRHIGLSSSGQPLPLLGGARLSGRVGQFGLGLLNIQQEEPDEGGLPSNNFTVMRLRYDVFGNSDVGAIFVDREGGDPGDYNRSYGVDANFQFFQNLTINSYLARTQTPGDSEEDFVSKISSQWSDGFLLVRGLFTDIGENFNPEVGLAPRRGVRVYQYHFELKPRPEGGFIREFHPHSNTKYYTDRNNITLTKDSHHALSIIFADGGTFEVSHNPQFERLRVPFELRENITIPPGDYHFNEFKTQYTSDRSQLFRVPSIWKKQGFSAGIGPALPSLVPFWSSLVSQPKWTINITLWTWKREVSGPTSMLFDCIIPLALACSPISSYSTTRTVGRS